MNVLQLKKNIYLIENLRSDEKCNDFISKTEVIGYEPATVQTENGPRLVDFIRNNNRVIYNFDLANELWLASKDYAPTSIGKSVAIGLNELFGFINMNRGNSLKNIVIRATSETAMKQVILLS
jgi:hypothetical protein